MKKIIGCNSAIYQKFSLEKAIDGIAKAGFKYIEICSIAEICEHIMPERMQKAEVERLKEQLANADLKAISILNFSDLATKEGIEVLRQRIILAKEMGIGLVNTAPGNVDSREKERLFYANILEIATVCKDCDVKVALEIQGHLTPTGKDCLATLKKIDSPFIGITYDTANVIYYGGVRPEDDIKNILENILNVHLKDKLTMEKGKFDFPIIGSGIIDFNRIFALLDEYGYEGIFITDIEPDREEIKDIQKVNEAVKKSYEYLKRVTTIKFTGVQDP